MSKYSKRSLQKVETVFRDLGYTVRYEKGNFQSGYCLVENSKVLVVNKFFDTSGRVRCMLDILSTLYIDLGKLSNDSKHFLQQFKDVLSLTAENFES